MTAARKAWAKMTPDERLAAWDEEDAAGDVPTEGQTRSDAMGGASVFWHGRWRSRENATGMGWVKGAATVPKVAAPAVSRRTTWTAGELWSASFPPVPWVVPDLLPPGLTLLAGAPKLGKSWLALDICRAVSEGGTCLGNRPCETADVLYAALEDNGRSLKARILKSFPSAPGHRLTFWLKMEMLDQGGLDEIRQWIAEATKPRLIVIDVLNKVRAAKGRGEDSYPYDYRSVTPLKELADETGLAIVIIHHTRKAEAGDKLEKVSGTNGLTGAADTTWVLDRDGEGVTLSGRGRELAEFESAMEFDRDTCRWRLLGDAAEIRRSDERTAILQALKDAAEPMTSREIADVTDQTDGNVRRLLAKMVRAGEVTKVSRGKYLHPDINPGNIGNKGNNEGSEP